jgi:hypothetical protein
LENSEGNHPSGPFHRAKPAHGLASPSCTLDLCELLLQPWQDVNAPKIEPVICFSLIYVLVVNKLYKGKYQTEQSIKDKQIPVF